MAIGLLSQVIRYELHCNYEVEPLIPQPSHAHIIYDYLQMLRDLPLVAPTWIWRDECIIACSRFAVSGQIAHTESAWNIRRYDDI